ncbi:MAG TPA: hypothetical protein DEB39_13870 [Planctomycetaceae bacterium]|nr:hypothetical protein [Planctomycetaceae bacterium]
MLLFCKPEWQHHESTGSVADCRIRGGLPGPWRTTRRLLTVSTRWSPFSRHLRYASFPAFMSGNRQHSDTPCSAGQAGSSSGKFAAPD